MREGNSFSLSTVTGGTHPKGVLYLRCGWGGYPVPGPDGGYPIPAGLDGGTPSCWWGSTLSQIWMGGTLSQVWTGGGGCPIPGLDRGQGSHISGLTKFHDISMIFPGFSKKFQVYFLNIFNVASNYFWINVYIKISPNQKYIISTLSQGSHISRLTKFHDISMIFISFCKIPWFFQVFQVYYLFFRFSSKCRNPEGGIP